MLLLVVLIGPSCGDDDEAPYVSVERDPANGNQPTHARDRIGTGPWLNANRAVVANTVAELHARIGDAAVFLDERAQRINGQWTGSPSPVQHDILTGSLSSWNSAHANQNCADTAPRGGAGRFYCFAR